MVLKVNLIVIDFKKYLEVIKVNKKEFWEIFMEVSIHYQPYLKRDRKSLILKKISKIHDFFGFNSKFLMFSSTILRKFWPFIEHTKDDIIAGIICTLSVIGLGIKSVRVYKICEIIGIKMSSINYQIKYNIFGKLKISGFKSLKKSSDLIKRVLLEITSIEFESHSFVSE